MKEQQRTLVSGQQFAIFRIAFGVYLTLHFVQLAAYAPELFGSAGMLPDATLNFTHGILPNPLEHWGSASFVTGFVLLLAVLSAAYTLGIGRRLCALLLWYGWACLFNRNNLISNPSIPYVGVLLLLTAIIPAGEPLRMGRRDRAWEFPSSAYWVAWILMAVGYSFSGWAKLPSPSWLDGSALWHVAQNPLARPGLVRDALLHLPTVCLQWLTWGCLAAELLFLPLSLHRFTRALVWAALVLMHAGILLVVDFADLSIGMLMIHLFTFDRSWMPQSWRERMQKGRARIEEGWSELAASVGKIIKPLARKESHRQPMAPNSEGSCYRAEQ
jgi:hypothetical protein